MPTSREDAPIQDPLATTLPGRHEVLLARFASSWHTGRRPLIERILAEFPKEQHTPLFRSLLAIELKCRAQLGEQPRPADYLPRFPSFSPAIDDSFNALALKSTACGESGPRFGPSTAIDLNGDSVATTFLPRKDSTLTEPSDPSQPPSLGAQLPLTDHWDDNSLPCTRIQEEPAPTLIQRRYRVIRKLGGGGFGRVYLAWDQEILRDVAIKVPKPGLFTAARQIDDFLREAQMVAKLSHPGIVKVYDIGRLEDGTIFVVMEYVEGQNLADLLQNNSRSLVELVAILALVAAAVHHAHKRGLVHRDLKPENILIDRDGVPHVADFGLAVHEDFRRLRSGEIAGTPAYMAPEQVLGETHRFDGRTDVWGLGVVLYQILSGRRPFTGTRDEVFEEILHRDPKPPRQINDSTPEELERICLKCLMNRMTDRYTNAADLAAELRVWTDSSITDRRASITPDREPPKLVPKGLRAFDREDADFFLDLLPGPRDRCGIPESIRFWKLRIEETDPDRVFRVGLVYGPSGCGKSSLMKAGILPRLSGVLPIYIEATAADTEQRLRTALRRHHPPLTQSHDLVEDIAALRGNPDLASPDRKVLIVIDQFEQWLHAHPGDADAPLIRALRQCDGRRVQCILLVRDDFWMAITGFLRNLEVKLVEGENSSGFELFDAPHARRVLAQFGRAYGRLPDDLDVICHDQSRFLDQAVDSLKRDDGCIVPVRLSMFAEMMRAKPWIASVLQQTGGPDGIGAAYLEETFGLPSSPPTHRLHQHAARSVLKTLLPARDTAIKGGMRTRRELLAASGYTDRPGNFDELMDILDSETRLITPTDARGLNPDESLPLDALTPAPDDGDRCYQLTHDELVRSIRLWLTRHQRETRSGRAELRLEEQSSLWDAHPEHRYLPSFPEWCCFRLYTFRARWNLAQRRMMAATQRRFLLRSAAAAAAAAALVTIALLLFSSFREERLNHHAALLLRELDNAEYANVPSILSDLHPLLPRVQPELKLRAASNAAGVKRRVVASLALLPGDQSYLPFLEHTLLTAKPDEFLVVRDALEPHSQSLVKTLWDRLRDPAAERPKRLRAAAALAAYDPNSPAWPQVALDVTRALVSEERLQLPDWSRLLRPVRTSLIPNLKAIFLDPKQSDSARTISTLTLADYLQDEPTTLSELILDANPERFRILIGDLHDNPKDAITQLTAELERLPQPLWNDPPAETFPIEPSPAALKTIETAHGIITPQSAFCQTLPLSEFQPLSAALSAAGYRPTCLRPYAYDGALLAAVAWTRDGRPWKVALHKSSQMITDENSTLRPLGFLPADLAAYPAIALPQPIKLADDDPNAYCALWVDSSAKSGLPLDFSDARMYVAVPELNHQTAYQPLDAQGFIPRTGFRVARPGNSSLNNSVRWKTSASPYFGDTWDQPSWEAVKTDVHAESDLAKTPVELRFSIPERPGSELNYASIWWSSAHFETRAQEGLSPQALLADGQTLLHQGFRLWSVSATSLSPAPGAPARIVAAAIWRRPVITESQRDDLARHQANATVALFSLGKKDALWNALLFHDDPRLRSELITQLAPLGFDPRDLLDRLKSETEVATRRALLMALAGYDRSALPKGLGKEALDLIDNLFHNDPDPGVHSAAELLLNRSGRPTIIQPSSQPIPPPGSPRRWYVDPAGHTMIVLPGPLEFLMGSPGSEPERQHHEETLHKRRIDRTLAVASKEVTFAQFRLFDPNHNQAEYYSPQPDDPANKVNFFAALKYCNWLSEKTGIPREDWCYEEPIGPGIAIGPELVSKTGYRLPTEAEWEYFCRAGTRTSRYYGHSETLLPLFAVTVADSGYKTKPVGSLLPNDFGLFDTLGNVWEWCNGEKTSYLLSGRGDIPWQERVDKLAVRNLRGGSFLYIPSCSRASQRQTAAADRTEPHFGFRVVRTLPSPPPAAAP